MRLSHTGGTVDLDHLRAVHAVARLGSLSAAADELLVGQPTLSRRVRALEDELGVALFHRTGRGMVPTAEGAAFVEWTRDATDRLVRARDLVRTGGDETGALLRIGLVPTVGAALTGDLVERLRAALPQARLRVREAYSAVLVDALHRDELDLAVIYGTSPGLHLDAVVVAAEQLGAVCRPGDLPPGPTSLAQMGEHPLVLPSTSHGLRAVVDEAFARAGVTRADPLEADGFGALKELVRRGLGVTVLPATSVAREVADGLLAVHPIEPEPPTRSLAVATARGAIPGRTTVTARAVVVDALRRLLAPGAPTPAPALAAPPGEPGQPARRAVL